jgi:hypothetical protein
MTQVDELALARRAKIGKSAQSNALVREIVDVLLELGGSAHRDLVIDRIALRRGGARASDGLTLEVVAAFEHHRARASGEHPTAVLFLPFGEGSRRWGVAPIAGPRLPQNTPGFPSDDLVRVAPSSGSSR